MINENNISTFHFYIRGSTTMANYKWTGGNIKLVEEIEQQTALAVDQDGSLVLDTEPESKPMIVDESGLSAEETEMALSLIRGGRFNAKLFHEKYEDNTEFVLRAILSLQSNDNPLKKGGDNIAYRCSAIIIQNRQNYTVPQNTLLDIITAKMSSHPDDKYYVISAKDVAKELPYKDPTYVYKIMTKTCEELNRSPFKFEIELANGKKQILDFQWNEVLTYNGNDNLDENENAYISFVPTKFFRILTLSSTIMHGAHFPVGVSAQISSKYARNLFYYLEDMKNYQEYPNATPGIFTLSLEEFRMIVKYPGSYRTTDIRRFVLDTAEREINSAIGIDFVFRYEFKKTGNQGRKKITHIQFIISKLVNGKTVEVAQIEEKPAESGVTCDSDEQAPLQVLKGIGLTDKECQDVLRKYKENNRDLLFLTQAIASILTNPNVRSKCAVLCTIMDKGLNPVVSAETKKNENKFNNFNQRDYDYDELERILLNSQN